MVEVLIRSCFSVNGLTHPWMMLMTTDTALSSFFPLFMSAVALHIELQILYLAPCRLFGSNALRCSAAVLLDSSSFQAELSCISRSVSVIVHCDFSDLVHRARSNGLLLDI